MSSSSINWNKFGDYAGLATQGIGVIGQVASAFYSARSARRNADLQAFMAEMNAKGSERQAQQAFLRRDKEIAALGVKTGRLKKQPACRTCRKRFGPIGRERRGDFGGYRIDEGSG